jgi:transcriptional antiterminator RfaH
MPTSRTTNAWIEGIEDAQMPLLPLEPIVFPEDLLSEPTPPLDEMSRWWVLHTRPRSEKALGRRLLKHAIPFFLPLHEHRSLRRGRLLSSFLPLFPGYVFMCGDEESRLQAVKTNFVASCLAVSDQDRLRADLARVHRMLGAGLSLVPEDRLVPGMRVVITTGPLMDLEGTILRRGRHLRFFVEVQFLQRGVSAEIESWMFRPLETPLLTGVGR